MTFLIMPNRRRTMIIVAFLYFSISTYGLPTHMNRRSHMGRGFRPIHHRDLASSYTSTNDMNVVEAAEGTNSMASVTSNAHGGGLTAFQLPRVSRHTDNTTRAVEAAVQSAVLPSATLFDFLQVPWDVAGTADELTSLVLPVVQAGLDATSTSVSELPTPTSAESDGQSAHSASVTGPVVAAYYADWASNTLAPEDVDFSRFNWIDFGKSKMENGIGTATDVSAPSRSDAIYNRPPAFAIPNENFELVFTQENSEDLLHRLVATGHAQGQNVKLVCGGWTGGKHFSRAVGSVAGRAKLCHSLVNAYHTFNLDGIEIDWEYPNQVGAGNEHSPDDTNNFLLFLKQLRKKLPSNARITAATQVWPFADKNGTPIASAANFAKVLDWVMIMNYDVWGSSPNPGPNAPLSDGCGNSTQPLANAEAAIRSWVSAGFSVSQIVLGVPAYGYVSRSDRQQLATRNEMSDTNSTSGITMGMSTVELQSEDGGSDAGQIQFNQLVKQGALVRNSGGGYDGAGGFERRWDSCSSTPWLRSEAQRQVITYDDPESMRLKGEMGRRAGILGVNMFAAHGDDGWALIDGARRGLGVIL